jgi:type IX secretion system PorP/SprF family membrane protein
MIQVKNIFLIVCCFVLLNTGVKAQDLVFSQLHENTLVRNPALAGIFNGDFRVDGTFRNQWQSITVPYKTQAFSTEVKFPIGNHSDWMTAGVQITRDVAGDIQLGRTSFQPVVNYHKLISNDSYLSLAFMGGAVISQFDPSQIMLGDQFNASTGSFDPNIVSNQVFSRTNFIYWDASTGLSWSSRFDLNDNKHADYYLGVGLYHFNKPKVGFFLNEQSSKLNPRFALNAGITLPLSDYASMEIFGDYFRQGGNRQFMGGLLYCTNIFHNNALSSTNEDLFNDINFYAGAIYRWNDALIPTIKLDFYHFSAGISYDITLNQLATVSQLKGGMEFNLFYRASLFNHDGLPCPRLNDPHDSHLPQYNFKSNGF